MTQNVDGLHQRAGSSLDTFPVHGWIDAALLEVLGRGAAAEIFIPDRDAALDDSMDDHDARRATRCCGRTSWFDEYYDEALFRADSTMRAAQAIAGLVVVGTSGQTSLPAMIVQHAVARRAVLVVDPNDGRSPKPHARPVASIGKRLRSKRSRRSARGSRSTRGLVRAEGDIVHHSFPVVEAEEAASWIEDSARLGSRSRLRGGARGSRRAGASREEGSGAGSPSVRDSDRRVDRARNRPRPR